MGKIKRFLLNRLDERSTWRALVALLTIGGITLTDVQTEAIVVAGVALGALLEAFLPDPAGRIRQPVDDDIDYDELADDELLDTVHNLPDERRAASEDDAGRGESAADAARRTWLG